MQYVSPFYLYFLVKIYAKVKKKKFVLPQQRIYFPPVIKTVSIFACCLRKKSYTHTHWKFQLNPSKTKKYINIYVNPVCNAVRLQQVFAI